jgi:hypothetical protein
MKTSVRTVLATGLAAVLLAPGAAVAATSDAEVDIAPKAVLVAKGAAVEAAVTVTCEPVEEWGSVIDTASVTYTVTQKVQRGLIATESHTTYGVTCNGAPQEVTFVVAAESIAFKHGVALAAVTVQQTMAVVDPVTATIRLK